MATLRNLAISVLRLNGHTNIAAGRYAARKPDRPLTMINNVYATTHDPGPTPARSPKSEH